MLLSVLSLLTAATAFAGVRGAVQKVTRSGRYLYTADGNRFYIKGVAYQEAGTTAVDPVTGFVEPTSFVDPLEDSAACARDVPILQGAGVNAVRVYSTNSSNNHDSCMNAFDGAGIYTIIDLALPINGSIDRAFPSWSTNLLNQYIATIDAFSKYENVLAYNIGNEVVTSPNQTDVAPYLKAATRDVKAYLKSKGLTTLVGYASVDGDSDYRDPLATYLECSIPDNSDGSSLDLYGINNYRWCGADNFNSAYAALFGDYAGYSIPAYFSEYGCVNPGPRDWSEVPVLLSSQMSPIFSGGVAFSYFPAESSQGQFGMVTVNSDGTVTPSDDFNKLKAQYTSAQPPNQPSQSGSGTTNVACPTANSTFFAVTTLPPTPNEGACDCLEASFSCRFTPTTPNVSTIVGDLINTGCNLLGAQGGNCNAIGGSGSSGQYGALAMCDPSVKASYVFSQFYEATNRNPASCNFAGNATVNNAAPSSVQALNDAASSCLANATGTAVPTAPGSSGGSAASGSGGSSPTKAASSALAVNIPGLMGVLSMAFCAIGGGIWTLA